MMSDTTAAAAEAQIRALRAMTPQRRLALAAGWSRSVREMTRTQLRREGIDVPDGELHRRLATRLLGEELALKAYGSAETNG